ncbi:putative hydro-lyase [Nonomuraea antri]|uniref:putative hydro-lyase n=1 Tax=Nonomuraea antri TaxID=2730852 RepID=UPI001C2C73E9|nr:putative hydro-lyase [Nonomuraea antri]
MTAATAATAMPADPSLLTPHQARAILRTGPVTPTCGWSAGWTQANLIALPRDRAYDFLLFAQRNAQACPVLDVTEPGETAASIFDGDLRTDLSAYRVYEHGEQVAEVTDVTSYWRDDLVCFLIGCSFTFESALAEAGVPVRHVESGTNVPMYCTDRQCRPAGGLSGPKVVSMRPMPAELVPVAVRVTSRYPAVHGAPVHVGDPSALGIDDLGKPDFGDPVEVRAGELPVFWECGVTSQAAVMRSRPPFAISHAPGSMAITDARDSAYLVP